jgi:hypothetical protein
MNDKTKLDEKELNLVDVLIKLFQTRFAGNENAVKTESLIAQCAKEDIIASGSNIRRVLGHIRQNDLLSPAFILSDVHIGYWLSNNESEMNAIIDKQLNRMASQFQNLKPLHQRIRYGKKDITELQTQLF